MENNKKVNLGADDGLEGYSDDELLRAVGLMVRPEWLRERAVMVAILRVLDYNGEDVAEVLAGGQPLHDGPQLAL